MREKRGICGERGEYAGRAHKFIPMDGGREAWTREEVVEMANVSGLGRVPLPEIHAICKLLNCREGGPKKVLVARIHAVLQIPYDEQAYNAVGWVMPLYRSKQGGALGNPSAPPPAQPPDVKRFQWDGSVQQQLDQARTARVVALQEIRTLAVGLRQAMNPVLEDGEESGEGSPPTPGFTPALVAALMKSCETSLARYAALEADIQAIDRQAHMLLARHVNTFLNCPICLDETRTEFRLMHPCGHVVCLECSPNIGRRCPTCRDRYLISSRIFYG